MSSKRRTYTREFKIEAVKLSYNSEKTVEEIAESLGVGKSSLQRWRGEFGIDPDQAFPGKGQRKERDEEVLQLKKKLKQAEMENEILKKAMAIFTRHQR
ncbi:MAG: transposase [Chloroflexota bacterium]